MLKELKKQHLTKATIESRVLGWMSSSNCAVIIAVRCFARLDVGLRPAGAAHPAR